MVQIDELPAPLVSVIIPSYNHQKYVEQAIRSVWQQTYTNIELIVVDDASTDNSQTLLKKLHQESPIPMQLLLKDKNKGVSNSVNTGVTIATGEWISFLSSDDYYAPHKIARQIAQAQVVGHEYGCLHSDAHSMDEHGNVGSRIYARSALPPLRGDGFRDLVFNRCRIIATSSVIRKDLIQAAGGFDELMVAEDYDFYLRLARLTHFWFLDEPLLYVRTLASSLGRQPWRWADGVFAALEKHQDVAGFDWKKVKADRWRTLLPNFLENSDASHMSKALGKAYNDAVAAKVIMPFVGWVVVAVARATMVRIKRFLFK